MAQATRKLNATKMAYVKKSAPTTHYTPSGTNWYPLKKSSTEEPYFYIQFQEWPAALRHYVIIGVQEVCAAFRAQNGGGSAYCYISDKTSADIDTVTFNTKYSRTTFLFPNIGIYGASPATDKKFTGRETSNPVARSLLLNRIVEISGEWLSTNSSEISARLADGTSLPYATIVYDDEQTYNCTAKMTYPSSSGTAVNISTGIPQTFTWALEGDSNDPFGWAQNQATFYWRVRSSTPEEWKSVQVNGDVKSATFPGKTFTSSRIIEYYVVVIDEFNTTHYIGSAESPRVFSSENAFGVPTSPANNTDIDPTKENTFSWIDRSQNGVTTYDQIDGYFCWTDTDDSEIANWNQINVGSRKSIEIPPYTFPSGKTIKWNVRVNVDELNPDNTYTYYADYARTVNTLPYSLEVLQLPSGSNICSGNPIAIVYELKNSDGGEAIQRESRLFWRADTLDPYTVIQNSTSTKSIAFPANTLPTGGRIEWYIEVTATDGSVYSTTPATFSTATSLLTPQSSPTAGYTNPRNPITFSWYFAAGTGSVAGTASLFWKVSTDETYTQVTATGNSITIPANTFPVAATIEWYLAGEDYSGHASQTSVYSFSTEAAAVRAITNYPVNGTVDGSEDITFRWTFDTADGFPPSRVEFAWKLPAESTAQWHIVTDTTTPITEYTIPAGTFPAGQIDWRIRAWNIDSVLGNEGTASFINLIAPTITTASATAVPFSTIAWQCDDQQSFELEIDGKRIGPYFGTEKRYTVTEYLEDGVHSIRIRVMGSIGLWSQWAETTVDIHNASEDEIELTGTGPVEAALQWTTESATANFLIYRDGAMIGHTTRSAFSDRLANGEHTYVVINRLPSGNYDKSNEVNIELSVPRMTLAAIDGEEWLEIPHALTSQRDPEYTKTKTVAFNHLSGHDYPTAITSELYEAPMSATAAFLFTETEANKKFLKLFGIPIIVKAADGSCFVGIISSWRQQPRQGYYTAYTFTVNRIDWEDYVDAE